MSPIRHEDDGRRGAFYIEEEGRRVAEMTYRRRDSGIAVIIHTRVDDELKGHGVGHKLLAAVVAWARETGIRLRAICPFAKAQFERDASLRDVLA